MKGVTTVVLKDGFVSKGIYKVVGTRLRGTWSVIEKTVAFRKGIYKKLVDGFAGFIKKS